jgi:DNA-binding response OmpR family regulator
MTNAAPRAPLILIVEDEPLVRMFAVDALEDSGFAVAQAGDAQEGLTALSTSSHDLKAVIVDLGLPDRTGDLLAIDMRSLREDLPIVIASGRSERELKDRFAHDARIAVLVKPYTAAMLLTALASLGVDAPTPSS